MARSLAAGREQVAGTCPECGSAGLQRYKVISAGGWFDVVKCPACLASVERAPWHRLGFVDRDQAAALIGPADGKAA
jgi:predicted RNA-binding Zn-ribbon protein involved in translation (DUF1610 family)